MKFSRIACIRIIEFIMNKSKFDSGFLMLNFKEEYSNVLKTIILRKLEEKVYVMYISC